MWSEQFVSAPPEDRSKPTLRPKFGVLITQKEYSMRNMKHRMTSLRTTLLATTLCTLGLFGTAHAQNLLANGSFETGDLTGWGVLNPVQARSDEGTTEGSFAAVYNFGNVFPGGYLFQDLTTIVGQDYTVSFDFGGFGVANTLLLQFQVITDPGGPGEDFLILQNISSTGSVPTTFANSSFDFTATSITTRVGFGDATGFGASQNADPVLDNVSVVSVVVVPEPGTFALVLSALGILGAVIARRRKTA